MVLLFFAVVGTNQTASVSVDEQVVIDHVKEEIAKKFPLNCYPAELTLYSTKRGEPGHEQWLHGRDADLRALQAPEQNEVKQRYLTEELELPSGYYVETYFPARFEEGTIHILVKLPERLAESPSRKRKSEAAEVDSAAE